MVSKKFVAAVFMIVCFLVVSGNVAAQTSGPAVDARLFSVDLGVVLGFDVGTQALLNAQSFGIDFVVADNMKVGFSRTNFGTNYNLIRFSYYLSQLLGFTVGVGSGGGAVGGSAGLFMAPIRGGSQAGISSSLKLKVEYMFNATGGIDAGYVTLGVVSSLGI